MDRFAIVKSVTVSCETTNGEPNKDMRPSRIGSTSSMDSSHSNSMSIYRKSYPSSIDANASFSSTSMAGSIQDDNIGEQRSLTQAELEEYSRSYFGQHIFHHQKQSSYAQSEGYHSYVSSSDSSSATPFLDRLRQESELLSRSSHWSHSDLQSTTSSSSSSTHINNSAGNNNTNINNNNNNNNNSNNSNNSNNNQNSSGIIHNTTFDNNSTESTSSSETLKWLGSMSDVSVASNATGSSAISGSVSSSQLIVHSSRVRTPKRHNSESVLYMSDEQTTAPGSNEENKENSPRERSSRSNNRLFPVGTYPEAAATALNDSHAIVSPKSQSIQQNWQSVADRISELERQHSNQNPIPNQKYTYLDPSKTTRVSNPALKAFQKNAVQSYFERQQQFTAIGKDSTRSNLSNSLTTLHSIGVCSTRPQSLPIAAIPATQKACPQSRSSLPNNYAQMNSSFNTNSIITNSPSTVSSASTVIATSVCTELHNICTVGNSSPSVASVALPKSSSSPIKVFNSPSPSQPPSPPVAPAAAALTPHIYQATFHQSVSAYNMGMNLAAAAASVTPPPPPPQTSIGVAERKELFNDRLSKSTIALMDLGGLQSVNESGVPPPPPRRDKSLMPLRRTSSASDYVAFRDQNIQRQSLSKDLLGPMVMGPIISLDDWVPERPPKNPMLRVPSPELPPPPPANYIENDPNNGGGSDGFHLDEPLPPPPPELLRHMRQLSELDIKTGTASRRNSFAGCTTKKPVMRAQVIECRRSPPPVVPKKPTSLERLYQRPLSSLSKHQPIILKPQKVIFNGKLEPPTHSMQPLPHASGVMVPMAAVTAQPRLGDTRQSQRKRSHNAQRTLEMSSLVNNNNCNKLVVSPPPLKPRLSINPPEISHRSSASAAAVQANRLRCNSKASYLPRQTREKPSTDPDHGSYKLTLTSNEDCINTTNSYQDDILNGKCGNNLPDVLPMGAKVQSSHRYGSQNSLNSSSNNNNNHNNNNNNNNNMIIPHSAPALSTSFSMKPLFHFSLSNRNAAASPPLLQAYGRHTSDSISPKYMSQSTIDLKKTHILSSPDPHHSTSAKMISSESEQNLSESLNGKQSPYAMRTEFVRKISFDDSPLMNRSSSSPAIKREPNLPIRKDSLKENIDKITQLQSKLMSAHLSENDRIVPNLSRESSYRSTTSSTPLTSTSTSTSTTLASALSSSTPTKCESPVLNPVDSDLDFESETTTSTTVIVSTTNVTQLQQQQQPPTHSEAVNIEATLLTAKPVIVAEISETIVNPPSPSSSSLNRADSITDTMKLVQRTEIVLRLNAPTAEAASQTDDTLDATASASASTSTPPSSPSPVCPIQISITATTNGSVITSTPPTTPTTKMANGLLAAPAIGSCVDDAETEKLSKELISQLSPSDRLYHILAPKTLKSSADYVNGLYNPYIRPRMIKKDAATSVPEMSPDPIKCGDTTNGTRFPLPSTAIGSETPSATTTTTKPSNPMRAYNREITTLVNGDRGSLTRQKEELVDRIGQRLKALHAEQTTVAEESTVNELLGNDLAIRVTQVIRPIDASKFRCYVDDVGHITMLLLSLSGRLAKVENDLATVSNEAEKKLLETKRNRLMEQLEEAKLLKEDIDRRGTLLAQILDRCLSIEDYADYDYFINMKAKLIVDARDIADKIRIGEEQLAALKDTLVQSEC